MKLTKLINGLIIVVLVFAFTQCTNNHPGKTNASDSVQSNNKPISDNSNSSSSKQSRKLDELVGYYFYPHAAMLNIRFYKDGKFVFHDNDVNYLIDTLTGTFELYDSIVVLNYDVDKPKDEFKFYRGDPNTYDSLNYYLTKEGYYFVKSDSDEK